jgi:glucokinase
VKVPTVVLAMDIGGTKLAAGVVSASGRVLAESVRLTDPGSQPPEVVEILFALAEDAISAADTEWRALAALGLSFGGPVDFPAGTTVTCHHLPGWERVALRDLLVERSGLPTVMDNDANAAGLGEVVFGAGQGTAHALYVTVSTGIGAGLVLDGRIYRGANSMAGELGHTLVAPEGPPCACGRIGCLEAVASGPAIARLAREALESGVDSALQAVPLTDLTAQHVSEAAGHDTLAARVMAQAGEYLGLAIASAVNLVNPEVVVVGGGVSQAGEVLLRPLRDAVQRHAVPDNAKGLRILGGQLGNRGGLLGAAALALREGVASEDQV